jgi:hypothetical protein
LPTWIAAVGTVAVSVWLLVLQLRDRALRRRRQAEQVAVWLAEGNFKATPPTMAVRVVNGSNLPIREVRLFVHVGVRGTFERGIPSMGPRETREWRIELPAPPRMSWPDIDLTFVDAASAKWLRTTDGRLVKWTADAPGEDERRSDPGAWVTAAEHPTLDPAWDDVEAEHGRKVAD